MRSQKKQAFARDVLQKSLCRQTIRTYCDRFFSQVALKRLVETRESLRSESPSLRASRQSLSFSVLSREIRSLERFTRENRFTYRKLREKTRHFYLEIATKTSVSDISLICRVLLLQAPICQQYYGTPDNFISSTSATEGR